MSTPDEIRAKRLARLGAVSSSSRSSESIATQRSDTPETVAQKQVKKPTEKPTEMPIEKSVEKPVEQAKPILKIGANQSLSQWFVGELPFLFGASINADGDNILLESIAGEQHPENNLDEVFMEVLATGVPSTVVAEYLYGVYTRAFAAKRRMPATTTSQYDEKIAVFNQIVKLACRYLLVSIEEPEIFEKAEITNQIAWIIAHPNASGYLTDVIAVADEQGTLLGFLNTVVPIATHMLQQVSLAQPEYSNYLSLFETLVGYKPVARVFGEIDRFEPETPDDPLSFETTTVLGALFRLSALDPRVGSYYFSDIVDWRHASKTALNNDYSSVNSETKVVLQRLFHITNMLVRGSAETRNAVISWMGRLVNLSHLRRGSHADMSKLPSDGIMFNISMMLVRLSAPFLDYPVYQRLDKISMTYFDKPGSQINVDEESRVNASQDEVKEWREKQIDEDPNFVSHCFYLALSYLHFGMGGIFLHSSRIKQQLKQLYERLKMIEEGQVPQQNPMMLTMLRQQLPRLKEQAARWESHRHAIIGLFGQHELEQELFDFVVGSCTTFMRVIDPNHAYPQQKMQIPYFEYNDVSQLDDTEFLQSKAPEPWRFMPEYMIEGIINFCKFSTDFMACPLVRSDERKIMAFIEFTIVLLRCPELLGNPHMKSNLVELLFIGSLPMQDGSPGFFVPLFQSNRMVMDNLLFCLLDFYVMVEKTGASSQFYDKFNSRYHVSVILEEIWKGNVHYKNQLVEYSNNRVSFFVRFVARMLNDTTYLLDESFNDLAKIHVYQVEIKNRAQGGVANEELGSNEELEEKMEQSERTAKSCLGLANKTIELFKMFSKEVPQAFTLEEVVDRLAAMVDYNLGVLVGPKCSNLKVDDPEKYSFNPRQTLQDLCVIYVNLSGEDKFVRAVSRDGRSFDIGHFRKAQQILLNKTYTDPKLVEKFIGFAETAEGLRKQAEDEEMELGDVPDEFLDPLMFTVMEDPVILPTSKVSIDRSTIKAHLLSDPTDPFNRSPLKLEDVVPDTDLLAKIEAFKKSKRGK